MKFRQWFETSTQLQNRINAWKDFKSSKHHPFPSAKTNDEIHDVLAVLAGTKPAAVVKKSVVKDLDWPHIVQLLNQKNLIVREKGGELVIGDPLTVQHIVGLKNSNQIGQVLGH
jgi:hypothetical protein